MNKKELFKIALKYIEKGYTYENLKYGDDLYDTSNEDKEECLAYFEDIQEQGTNWAYTYLKELENDNRN